jgi:hypothetical protein
MSDEKEPPPKPSVTLNPAEATGLQDGVANAIVDFELVEQGGMVKIPQPKRKKRVVFKY